MAKKVNSGVVIFKVALWYCTILGIFAAYTNWLPQIRGDAPEDAVAVDMDSVTPEMLMEMGGLIIYGSDDPLGMLSRGEGPIGKGQCPLCHQFFEQQTADRCPNLIALPNPPGDDPLLKMNEEVRSHERVKEARYEEAKTRMADGDRDSGIVPHAVTGGEYLLESEYCPNCFVVTGFGVKGTNDTVSPMPIINKPPIELVDTEIVAVVTYLQSRDGDFSKATAVEDFENYFGKPLGNADMPEEEAKPAGPPIAMGSESAEEIVTKLVCYACHKIPGVSVAKTGAIGPLLIEGSSAMARVNSPEYQAAVKAGTAHATTAREYIIESIMDPSAFIVPGFVDDMMKDFKHKITVSGLDVLVDYLLAQTEETALADGMDRLANEKEGPIKAPEARIDSGEAVAKNQLELDGAGVDIQFSSRSLVKDSSTFIGLN